MGTDEKSHTLLDWHLLGAASKKEASKGDTASAVLLAGREGFTSSVSQLLLRFSLYNGIAVMFLKESLSCIESYLRTRGQTSGISGFALKRSEGSSGTNTWP